MKPTVTKRIAARCKASISMLLPGRAFGKSLYIDCLTQSAEADEIVYHEALVHAAMLTHPTGPKKVFMAGGGEGGTAREVCVAT